MHHGRSLFVLFWLLAALAQAQEPCTHELRGEVIDDHDGTRLELAEVLVVGTGRSAYTDEQGRFVITGLCGGEQVIKVVHVGCAPVTLTVQLPSRPIRVHMEHHSEQLKDVEVARKRPDENVGQAHEEIDTEALENNTGRSLGELLATIPGVNTLNSGPTISKPVIHGVSGNRVLILNQGVRQEDQQWGTEHSPSLDPFSTDRITVVKGAASVQYGSDAIGGVVITEPVELPRKPGLSGQVRALGISNGRGGGALGYLQGGVRGLRGLGWRLQGSGRQVGDASAARYTLSNTGLREAGISASMGYRDHRRQAALYYSWFGRELGILRAAHIGNLTDLQSAIISGEPWYVADFGYAIDAPRQTVQHHLLKAEAGYAVSERDRLVLTYAYQANDRQEYDIRRAGRDARPALDLFLVTHTGEAVFKHWIGNKLHGKVGGLFVHQNNSNQPGTGVRPLIPDHRKQSLGFFVAEHYPVSAKVEVELGVRIERAELSVSKFDGDGALIQREHRFNNSAISTGAAWNLKDSLTIRLNVSTAYRAPHVSELYSEGLHHGAAAIEQGDATLKGEQALKAVVDLSWVPRRGRFKADLTVHASRIDGFIYLRPDGYRLTIRGAFPVFTYTATDALIAGADLSTELALDSAWAWLLRASTVVGTKADGEWLLQMPSDRVENTVRWQRATSGAWKSFEVSLADQVVFHQVRYEAGTDFAPPPATYHLLGCGFSARRSLGRGECRLGLRASNLFNAAYRDLLDRFRYYADARGLDIAVWLTYSFGASD